MCKSSRWEAGTTESSLLLHQGNISHHLTNIRVSNRTLGLRSSCCHGPHMTGSSPSTSSCISFVSFSWTSSSSSPFSSFSSPCIHRNIVTFVTHTLLHHHPNCRHRHHYHKLAVYNHGDETWCLFRVNKATLTTFKACTFYLCFDQR